MRGSELFGNINVARLGYRDGVASECVAPARVCHTLAAYSRKTLPTSVNSISRRAWLYCRLVILSLFLGQF